MSSYKIQGKEGDWVVYKRDKDDFIFAVFMNVVTFGLFGLTCPDTAWNILRCFKSYEEAFAFLLEQKQNDETPEIVRHF